MTRTDKLQKAIHDAIEEHRLAIDRGVMSVVVTAKYSTGGFEPRDLWCNIQWERRAQPRPGDSTK